MGDVRFLPNICQICGKYGTLMISCEYCKLLSYCSEEHKLQHAEIHTSITCQGMAATLQDLISQGNHEFLGVEINDDDKYINKSYEYMSKGVLLLQIKYLKRSLTDDEKHLWIGMGRCHVCNVHDSISYCSKCYITGFCSIHKEQVLIEHEHNCKLFELGVRCSKVLRNNPNSNKLPPIYIPPWIRTFYQPLPCNLINSWNEYYVQRGFRPLNNQNEIEPVAVGFLNDVEALRAMYTDALSYPLTILYVLEQVETIEWMERIESLTIHMIGASLSSEFLGLQKYEELFHLLPSLKYLHLIGIGPLIPSTFHQHQVQQQQMLCQGCQLQSRQLTISFYSTMYETYCTSSTFIQPDLCIAYNCGIHELQGTLQDTWGHAIQYLLNKNLKTIFTCLNELEVEKDSQRIKNEFNGKLILLPQQNPYHGGKPMRQVFRRYQIFYYNYYLFAMQGKQEKDMEKNSIK